MNEIEKLCKEKTPKRGNKKEVKKEKLFEELSMKVVETFEQHYGKGESRGACHTIASILHAAMPNSRIVGGYIKMRQGKMQHWWIELKDGTVVDPLAEKWMDKPYEHIKVEEATMETKICPNCGQRVDENVFQNELSRKEFDVSGLCQKCQDKVFGR